MKRRIEVEFATDDSKALKIAERLLNQFYNSKGFFQDYTMPEYVLPRNLEEGTREHALFLTYVISIDKLTDAPILPAEILCPELLVLIPIPTSTPPRFLPPKSLISAFCATV